jgi:predicted amidohydrolase YtcJ
MARAADLILYNANVLTLDPQRPRAQMVAVKDGKIIRVGDSDERSDLEGRKIDCQGRTLVPGFNDAHCHILAFASALLSVDCSPSSVASIADIKAQIRKQARKLPKGTWIRATGYNEFYLTEKRHPNRYDLDEAAPDHPVKLAHRSGHACILNSLALAHVGISMESPEPPGGMIERDLDSGEPNGILFEMNTYIDSLVPPLSEDEFHKGIVLANEEYLSLGITSLQDATAHNGIREWHAFRRLREGGSLVPRLSVMMGIESLGELQGNGFAPHYGDDGMRLGALKIVLTEARGSLHPEEEELKEQVLQAHRAGYQLALHAVEESTVEAAIKALAHALSQAPKRDHRHRIEHCSVCPPALLEGLRDVHIIVVTQPSFIYYSGERYLRTVPESQLRWLYRIGSFLESGLMPAAGSDSPVAPINPLVGIYGAVTRKAENGEELLPQERISPVAALKMYTQSAAYASFDEGVKGSIVVGKLADFALLSADPTKVPPEEIKDIQVEMTIAGGRITWQA